MADYGLRPNPLYGLFPQGGGIEAAPSTKVALHAAGNPTIGKAVTLIAECRCSEGSNLSPPLPAMRQMRCRVLRRDVGGAIRILRAGGRRLEGERDGSRSRRPAVTVVAEASVMRSRRRPPKGTWPSHGIRPPQGLTRAEGQIGRASCRERG